MKTQNELAAMRTLLKLVKEALALSAAVVATEPVVKSRVQLALDRIKLKVRNQINDK